MFGERLLDALSPFVWRKVVDPKIAREMTELVMRGRVELSNEPERDLKLGPGGIREAEFFVQSLQLIWGGKEPPFVDPNTLEALRRLRSRGLVTDRESRDLESAYLTLRRLEHRVQFATGIQTHTLPRGELLETIARTVGHASGHELDKEVDKTRRRVAARFASLTKNQGASEDKYAKLGPLLSAIDAGEDAIVASVISDGSSGLDFSTSTSPDLARHLVGSRPPARFPARREHARPPSGACARLARSFGRCRRSRSSRAVARRLLRSSRQPERVRPCDGRRPPGLRKLVRPLRRERVPRRGARLSPRPHGDACSLRRGRRRPSARAREVAEEIAAATNPERLAADDVDEEDAFVGALRQAKARIMMEVGLAELAGELPTRDATLVLAALADATLEHATRRALAEKGLSGGLSVVAMGKLGGCEIGYGSDLDIFFVFETKNDDEERYVRAAQRVLRIVSTPHGDGPGYELDTRLRPSGSHGLLVVSLEAFARYHGLAEDGSSLDEDGRPSKPDGEDWERQALVKARPCAGDSGVGKRVLAIANKVAYGRGAPDSARVHHLRMRMQKELAREGPNRFDVKLGHGGIVDVEFATQWLQMKYGGDPRVRTTDTETALGALDACGYLDPGIAVVLREGYAMLRKLEQALRVVHGTSASFIEEARRALAALARRMGFRDGSNGTGARALVERYRAVTDDVRAAYLGVLGVPKA